MAGKYDLIIVGTGFASSFFLKKYLSKSSENVRVLVLERGLFHSHQSRLAGRRGETKPDIKKSKSTYSSNSSKPWVFDPNFGGSSNCWVACTPRFMPNDFKLKSKYGVGYDWPITYEDLDPYYYEVEDIMQIAGPKNTPFPRTRDYPLEAHSLSSVDKILQKKYGELYISQPAARPTTSVENRSMCCSSAVCTLCPVNSKFTIENSLKWLYDDQRVEIVYGAQAYALETNGDHIKSIHYRKDGQDIVAEGETFSLGANAIFNAHILLNSGDTNPNTGKGISEQIGKFAYVYFDGLQNVGGGSVISANGYMLYDGDHRRDMAACLIENYNTPIIRNERNRWREIALFKFVFEDLPNDNNRVLSSDNELVPKIEYSGHSDYTRRGIESLPERLKEIFSELPVERIEIDSYNQDTEYHVCGTTRMGESGSDSVIDKGLVHHQFRNLLLLGSGAYPAISAANPTLTLSALSLMAAENYF